MTLSNGCKSRVSPNSGNYIAKSKGVHRKVKSERSRRQTLAEVKSCPQKDRTEAEGYVGAQTFMWICEVNIVEVPFDKDHLLERILSPANLNRAYKAVMRNKGM